LLLLLLLLLPPVTLTMLFMMLLVYGGKDEEATMFVCGLFLLVLPCRLVVLATGVLDRGNGGGGVVVVGGGRGGRSAKVDGISWLENADPSLILSWILTIAVEAVVGQRASSSSSAVVHVMVLVSAVRRNPSMDDILSLTLESRAFLLLLLPPPTLQVPPEVEESVGEEREEREDRLVVTLLRDDLGEGSLHLPILGDPLNGFLRFSDTIPSGDDSGLESNVKPGTGCSGGGS
jgi:hypothetical protein